MLGDVTGTLTLSTFAGLTFTLGDGDDDSQMTFTGTLVDVNAALDGLLYRPTYGFSGAATVEIRTASPITTVPVRSLRMTRARRSGSTSTASSSAMKRTTSL